mmetsp:Transcript_6562/g.8870  ORF Transcript_6562/g.8870 Transcript_6562/m.8870 type:complete len:84 (+) Transcript_6562:486-737(+)
MNSEKQKVGNDSGYSAMAVLGIAAVAAQEMRSLQASQLSIKNELLGRKRQNPCATWQNYSRKEKGLVVRANLVALRNGDLDVT